VLADGTRRGIDGYYSLQHHEQPSWWNATDADASAVGVFENVPGSATDAIVIGNSALTVRSRPGGEIPYAQIHELTPPRKDPLPEGLTFKMKDGTVRELPVHGGDGRIMAIYRFLLAAVGEFRRPP